MDQYIQRCCEIESDRQDGIWSDSRREKSRPCGNRKLADRDSARIKERGRGNGLSLVGHERRANETLCRTRQPADPKIRLQRSATQIGKEHVSTPAPFRNP